MGRWGTARRPGASRPASGPAGAEGRPGGGQPAAQARSVVTDPAARIGFAERVLIIISGVRQPIVAILLAISFFSVISGKPLDGLLIVTVATALAWDAGMRVRELAAVSGGGADLAGQPDQASPEAVTERSAWRLRTGRPRLRHIALGMGAAVIYSLTVGSFTRYSWPATAGVVGLGAGVVIVGWGGPTRRRVIPGKFARPGVVAWGSLLVAGGLWELGALLGQPTFEQASYAHPTISALTDPLLHSSLGRTFALFGWIALGAYLVER